MPPHPPLPPSAEPDCPSRHGASLTASSLGASSSLGVGITRTNSCREGASGEGGRSDLVDMLHKSDDSADGSGGRRGCGVGGSCGPSESESEVPESTFKPEEDEDVMKRPAAVTSSLERRSDGGSGAVGCGDLCPCEALARISFALRTRSSAVELARDRRTSPSESAALESLELTRERRASLVPSESTVGLPVLSRWLRAASSASAGKDGGSAHGTSPSTRRPDDSTGRRRGASSSCSGGDCSGVSGGSCSGKSNPPGEGSCGSTSC